MQQIKNIFLRAYAYVNNFVTFYLFLDSLEWSMTYNEQVKQYCITLHFLETDMTVIKAYMTRSNLVVSLNLQVNKGEQAREFNSLKGTLIWRSSHRD